MTAKQLFYKTRSQLYRAKRLIFASPAEMKFIEIMGGRVIKLPLNSYYVLWCGWTLARHFIQREKRYGRVWCDFGNRTHVIEIDGAAYHNPVVDRQRDEYLDRIGVDVLRIDATDIYNRPEWVRNEVRAFLGV